MSKTYQITINPPSSATGTAGGFLDNQHVQQRTDDLSTISTDNLDDKRRGNLRWDRVIGTMSMVANPNITDIVTTDATAEIAPTVFKFKVSFVDDAVLNIIRNGTTFTGVDALKQIIAEAFVGDFTAHCTIPDNLVGGKVERVVDLVVGALAADITAAKALVTVVQL